MAVKLELNEASQLFLLVAEAGTCRKDIFATLLAAVARHPEIGSWDCIADLRQPLAGSPTFNITSLAPLFDREGSKPALTVLLTDQPRMANWIRLLNYQFKSRRYCVAASMEEARGLLEVASARYERSWP